MPQMAPLFWLMLFLVFSTLFLLNLILNFFIKMPAKKASHEAYDFYDLQLGAVKWKW
uniref:ATP synthase F0 subunit 8 n=1 Tax=Lysmata amboinensis TaxID=575568 RepID=A0A7G7WQF3_9EUCA|nr:ATP synthase F0 subunit 8 [Lysmata amboinensis]QNH68780.1 ATP synthase F0 subunit 8 [Lysmata amboinensis]